MKRAKITLESSPVFNGVWDLVIDVEGRKHIFRYQKIYQLPLNQLELIPHLDMLFEDVKNLFREGLGKFQG